MADLDSKLESHLIHYNHHNSPPSPPLSPSPTYKGTGTHVRMPSDASLRRRSALTLRHRQQLRSYGLIAATIVAAFFFLQSLLWETRLDGFRSYAPSWGRGPVEAAAGAQGVATIMIASALFGEGNRFYEGAVASHDLHNKLHGYDMKVLRERITNGYFTKPSYMLSLIVNELTKPIDERTEWLMWSGPDIVLLNPLVPFDIFLPPDDFDHIHFLGTHDEEGLNLGVYFLRVHQWSARMLIDVLAYPSEWLGDAAEKDEVALEMVITSDGFRDHVQYQPRQWYNAYQLSASKTEVKVGDVAVHFHDLEGDKWSAMDHVLDTLASPDNPYTVPLEQTSYPTEVAAYWDRLRRSRATLDRAAAHVEESDIIDLVHRLQYATTYEADGAFLFEDAIDALTTALNLRET